MAWPAPRTAARTKTGAMSQGWRTQTGPGGKRTAERSTKEVAPDRHGRGPGYSKVRAEFPTGNRPEAKASWGLTARARPAGLRAAPPRGRACCRHPAPEETPDRTDCYRPPAHRPRTVGRGNKGVPFLRKAEGRIEPWSDHGSHHDPPNPPLARAGRASPRRARTARRQQGGRAAKRGGRPQRNRACTKSRPSPPHRRRRSWPPAPRLPAPGRPSSWRSGASRGRRPRGGGATWKRSTGWACAWCRSPTRSPDAANGADRTAGRTGRPDREACGQQKVPARGPEVWVKDIGEVDRDDPPPWM